MPKRALVEKRPWLLASLVFGIGFVFVKQSAMPGLYQIAWKGAAVGLLALYALLRHGSRDARLIALVLGLGAAGDMAIELDRSVGAALFAAAHLIAAGLYWSHRREQTSVSQRTLAAALLVLVPAMGWRFPADRAAAPLVLGYAVTLAVMAATAWTSSFPRYRVGTGALLFVASDLLLFGLMGPLAGNGVAQGLVWPLYYFGQFLICVGVLGTLRERDL